ncbi:esterase [Citricoccus sp. SGAir0253]|uniref:glycerophosphodiester phosphodiesterase family protein n=1 Tax=Citricoccus sp. SGAir0253 TaxID=2567881 RepID=UPI0010CCEBBF|nr:glycerophosphodiester phosphodiesterase family protein [Citricoccus sp. SGAir0253]QCU77072.1 esterase [Citricoccus sp. SGAir0253]
MTQNPTARRRPVLRAAAAGAATAAALSAAVLAPSATAAPAPEDAPVLIGHRGAAGTAPENTVAAFEDGVASGADFFEIDVQLSADGVPFLFHDNTPARTTNVAEVFPGREDDPITSFTWDELQQLDAGSYFSEEYAGERIPHLDDAAEVATRNTGVFIEIKSPVNSPGIEQVVADALAEDAEWSELVEAGKIEVLGFDEASNQRFAEIAPDVPLQQLVGTVPDAATLERYATFADAFGTNYRTLDEAGAERVRDAGLGLGVYTVNSTEAYDEAAALGVDRITGDFPIQFSRYERGLKVFPQNTGVQVADSVNDVPGADLQPETGEHVVLENTGNHAVDVSGWILRDAANNVLEIGEGYELEAGERLRVYTGPGADAEDAYYNGGTANVLNNGGDSVALWTDDAQLQDTFAN